MKLSYIYFCLLLKTTITPSAVYLQLVLFSSLFLFSVLVSEFNYILDLVLVLIFVLVVAVFTSQCHWNLNSSKNMLRYKIDRTCLVAFYDIWPGNREIARSRFKYWHFYKCSANDMAASDSLFNYMSVILIHWFCFDFKMWTASSVLTA